jgi:iron complex outermembrane receptor protein
MAMTKTFSPISKTRLSGHVSFSALIALLAMPDLALAQQTALEEIVVTARKREESLQDVPLSITAFSAYFIEKNGIRSIDDVAKLTPSLVFETAFVPQDTRPVIRGLSATRGRQPIGVLLDGIDVSSESLLTGGGGIGVNLRLVDVERIEVVKGPQSALYGRAAFGGAINYISKKPSDEFEGRAFTDIGNNGQFELTGSVSGPVVDDVLALRVNASYAQHNGFYTNSISGEKVGDYESVGGAIAARFTPNDQFTIDARVSYSEDEAGPAAQ